MLPYWSLIRSKSRYRFCEKREIFFSHRIGNAIFLRRTSVMDSAIPTSVQGTYCPYSFSPTCIYCRRAVCPIFARAGFRAFLSRPITLLGQFLYRTFWVGSLLYSRHSWSCSCDATVFSFEQLSLSCHGDHVWCSIFSLLHRIPTDHTRAAIIFARHFVAASIGIWALPHWQHSNNLTDNTVIMLSC